MNRRSRGFTLTELLTALVIHSFFILMLGGIFYTLISFGSRSQMTMTARERGQRVINYIDSRVRRAGLGMWRLEKSSEIREALVPLTEKKGTDGSALYNSENPLTLPVVVTYDYKDNVDYDQKDIIKAKMKKDEDNGIYYGNVLMLIYAQRETGTDSDSAKLVVQQNGIVVDYSSDADNVLKTLINQLNDDDFWKGFFPKRAASTISGQSCLDLYDLHKKEVSDNKVIYAATETLKDKYGSKTGEKIEAIVGYREIIKFFSGYPLQYKFLYNRTGDKGEFYYSDFGEGKKKIDSAEKYNIRAWGVSRGAGVPFIVDKYYDIANSKIIKEVIKATPNNTDYTIPDGDELLYLKGVRLFAMNPTDDDKKNGQPLRNLKVKKLNGERWGRAEPYQQGILEIYAELHTEESKTPNILSVWVLSTGGRDNMTHPKPADWPGRWREEGDNDDYKYFVTYVSKGTWKLNNLPEKFTWD